MVKSRRKRLKQIGWILLLSILWFAFFSPTIVLAQNEIESIQIKAIIQENGSVVIRDHRIFYAEEGTEHYISLGNLGDSELLAFVVYDDTNEPLEDIGAWDINASFSEKAGKYGVNHAGQEIELCFGLGAYGRREFTIEYELSNFIFNLADDHQAFYWQFINPDMDPIDSVEISVENNISYEFVYPESRIWGFGHEGGTTEITNDSLIFNSGEYFYQSDYVVLLGIFEGAPFLSDYHSDKASDELIELAMEGTLEEEEGDDNSFSEVEGDDNAFYEEERNTNNFNVVNYFSFFLTLFLFALVPLGIVGAFAKRTKNQKFKPSVTDQYYREVPYDHHFLNTQYFTNSEVSDWISAFILKWVSEGRLMDQVEEVGLIFKRDKLALKIMPNIWQHANELEGQLWDMLVMAAGEDRILSEKEFNRYVKRNIKSFNSWTDSVEKQSKIFMTQEGYLEEFTEKALKFFTRKKLNITQKGQQLGDNIVGFKNYLKDFSLLEERGVSHVALWQELMIWAAYMGIAEEVYEQLKIVNPQVEYEMPYSTRTIIMTGYFANTIQTTQSSANASSGGGGGSFGGGGGGASGGGSGGGTR